MLAYTVASVAGGTGQTTTAWNLAAAHAEDNRDVLAVDLTLGRSGLCSLLDIEEDSADDEGDTLIDHALGTADTPFSEHIEETAEGIDIVPGLSRGAALQREIEREVASNESFDRYQWLDRLLTEAKREKRYDTVVIDAAPADVSLYSALAATQHAVLPCVYDVRGVKSITRIQQKAADCEAVTDCTVRTMTIAPTQVEYTTLQDEIRADVKSLGHEIPVEFKNQRTLYSKCWKHHCSLFALDGPAGIQDVTLTGYQAALEKHKKLAGFLEQHTTPPTVPS